ncbi:helix-turn-helix domain-containing protein [Winogradskyella sp. MIT101101]|uniref:helix-turn-helix domain-containing protein n=1 Tax=Winogradskyella sp. MIT101101 TaxID=3098297 RepID=UPI003999669F
MNKFKDILSNPKFDLNHETNMVQSRILSTILQVMDDREFNQSDLENLTGLSQPFLSSIFNNKKNLSMKHIALIQEALGIVLQPPKFLDKETHKAKFYSENNEKFDIANLTWAIRGLSELKKVNTREFDNCIYMTSFINDESTYSHTRELIKKGLTKKGIGKIKQEGKIVYASNKKVNVYG